MIWRHFFVIKGVKHTVPQTYVISDIYEEEIVGKFYKKELQKIKNKLKKKKN